MSVAIIKPTPTSVITGCQVTELMFSQKYALKVRRFGCETAAVWNDSIWPSWIACGQNYSSSRWDEPK
jgi:hypothetical protein